MKRETIVTKEWLSAKVAEDPIRTIGRALVAIFRNQTEEEKDGNFTILLNNKGFTKADGRIGALGAKYFLKHKKLEEWQLKIWLKPNSKGQPRIVKYAKQLDEIARKKNTTMEMARLQTFNVTTQSHA